MPTATPTPTPTTPEQETLIKLKFPIEGKNPYNVSITSVLDHYRGETGSDAIVAYTAERGRSVDGEISDSTNSNLIGYKNSSNTNFYLTGEGTYYSGKEDSKALWYYNKSTGYQHPGYDYGAEGTIIAPADGKLYIVKFDKVNGPLDADKLETKTDSAWYRFHTFKIVHQNEQGEDVTAWYLHAEKFVDSLEATVRSKMGGDEVYNCQQELVVDIDTDEDGISDALYIDTVKATDNLAIVGGWGKGSNTTYPKHLHFEARLNNSLIDPYGWEGTEDSTDPLANNPKEVLWEGYTKPIITSATLDTSSKILKVIGKYFKQENFEEPKLQIWKKMESVSEGDDGTYIDEATNGITVKENDITDTQIETSVGDDVLYKFDSYTVKVRIPHGPRSNAFKITQKAQCEAKSISVSPTSLSLKRKVGTDITVMITGDDNCPVEGDEIIVEIDTAGKRLISISPVSANTDEEGNAVFNIIAKLKTGKTKVTFRSGNLKTTLKVKVGK